MSLGLLRMKFLDADSQKLLSVLESSAQRGAEMVSHILSFARGVDSQRVEVETSRVIREIEKFVGETFLGGIVIQSRVAPDLRNVSGDSTQLFQVVLNLCVNARDAMPVGGVLIVSAENGRIQAGDERLLLNPTARPGEYVMIEVKDSGNGIPPGILENIFDPFFTTKEVGQGTGLGLSTSLGIVKSHRGFMTVASVIGEGTAFQVFIPAFAAEQPSAVPPPSTALKAPSDLPRGKGELILVVDDEAPMRLVTQRILESYGYRVVLAFHGAEAVEIYRQRGFEIAAVLTDMTMPVMEGPEAIRILKDLNPKLRVVATSGLATTTYAARLAALGVQHVLPKPYGTAALLTIMKAVLDESGSGNSAAPS